MVDGGASFVPALGFHVLTPLFDGLVDHWPGVARFRRALVREAGLRAGMRALDMGCGSGTLALMLKETAPGAEIEGLDADPAILAIARRKAAASRQEVLFREGFADRLPHADGVFDAVVSSLMLHHVPPVAKRTALREAWRVLKPGGAFHVVDQGPPVGAVARLGVQTVVRLDGEAGLRDHVRTGLGPLLIEAGFARVAEAARYQVGFGTLYMHSAWKN